MKFFIAGLLGALLLCVTAAQAADPVTSDEKVIHELHFNKADGELKITLSAGDQWTSFCSATGTVIVRADGTYYEQMVSLVLAAYMGKHRVKFHGQCDVADQNLVASEVYVSL